MCPAAGLRHDGGMNDTQQPPETAAPDEGFDAHRLRTITDMRRSSDDRIVGGVCAGAARYLDIDPVIVRVVLAVLTVAGFAGVILYAAAWFLLPAEDQPRSIAADWFKLDRNEEQVRVAGLVGALVLAALSVVGDSSWAWWGGAPWWLVPFAVLFYVFWVRPQRRREAREALLDPVVATDDGTARLDLGRPARRPRPARSPALTLLTGSLAVIAVAATRIWADYHDALPWTTYVAVALGVVAIGLLVGTFFGTGGPLIGVGVLLSLALAAGSVVPGGGIGEERHTPRSADDVRSTYRQGVGLLELDLTEVGDPAGLLGRTIRLDSGVGETRIIVPDGLRVRVEVDLRAGELDVLGRQDDGTRVRTTIGPEASPTTLTLHVEQTLGAIEVFSR